VVVKGDNPDVLTIRDSSVDVDPYAAYYEQYAVQPQQNSVLSQLTEKQGFGNAMQNLLGPDAGLTLGAIGAVLGALAVVGVAVNNNNVNNLSEDQDSICTTTKALGGTTITALSTADITTMNAGSVTANSGGTRLSEVITALNGFATPDC
jgi:hypothetical protein